jgi:hypothetical protein
MSCILYLTLMGNTTTHTVTSLTILPNRVLLYTEAGVVVTCVENDKAAILFTGGIHIVADSCATDRIFAGGFDK